MACYHPRKGFVTGVTENGKQKLTFADYDVDHLEKLGEKLYFIKQNKDTVPLSMKFHDWYLIPCGKCVGCKLDYARQWADRCMLELQYHKEAWFLTLTYDDFHVPKTWYCQNEDGEAITAKTLCKRDLQLFFKRVRKDGQNIRYFAAGEYGDKTKRPHYHVIVYGLHLDPDKLSVYKVQNGYTYYNHPDLDRYWSGNWRDDFNNEINGTWSKIGHVVAGEVNWNTAAYTARYCVKKAFTDQGEFYNNFNLQPEFTLMSRRPGIAWQFYQDHRDEIYDYDYVSISTPKGGKNVRPSRYYDRLYDLDCHEDFQELKVKRKEKAEQAIAMELAQTGRGFMENLSIKEMNKIAELKAHKREEL